MSDTQQSSSFSQALSEALPLMPRYRERNKRNRSLTLDDLIDDQRQQNRLHSSALDLLLMSYRYQEIFNREQKLFLRKSLKPTKALDLWQLVFTALITRDHSSESSMIFQSIDFVKKEYGQYMAGALRAFCQKLIEKKFKIKEELQSRPELLLPSSLLHRWSKHPFMKIHDIASPLVLRPESGISAFDETLKWQKHGIEAFETKKLQALNEGSWLYVNHLFEEFRCLLKKTPNFKILDACAAPGGKLIALLQWAKINNVKVGGMATEAKYRRIERLKENLKNWEFNFKTELHAWGEDSHKSIFDESFDFLLIDLPCSGSGTLSQRPDLLTKDWNTLLAPILTVQEKILKQLLQLNFNTAFVSICSIDPEEIALVSKLLNSEPNFYSSKNNAQAMEQIVAWKILKNPIS